MAYLLLSTLKSIIDEREPTIGTAEHDTVMEAQRNSRMLETQVREFRRTFSLDILELSKGFGLIN